MHTPGPWTAGYDDNGFYYIHADGMPSPYIVATGGEGEADKANAELAASAPDLLAALEGLLQHACIADAAPEDVDEEDRTLERAARAAITKATRP